MRQRHVARHQPVTPADQPRIRDGVVRRATRAGRDQRRTIAGQAGDAVDTRGGDGFSHGSWPAIWWSVGASAHTVRPEMVLAH